MSKLSSRHPRTLCLPAPHASHETIVSMDDAVGLYISVPFCKAKCSFCNFASDVFATNRMDGYVDRLCAELRAARTLARRIGGHLPECVDTVYLGGGTPSLLEPRHLTQLFAIIQAEFQIAPNAEMTIEAAPGQIVDATLEAALRCGINRVSFGVQSFVDAEAAAVGRLHTGAQCRAEIARMRTHGVERLALDLIAGLPYQTAQGWAYSLDEAIDSGADHVSVYLLEVDEDSRLGREALAGGSRYHAGALPDEDETTDWYTGAGVRLASAGLHQYEISNFARPGFASKHNLKYWRRQPYLGLGLDAHSMLHASQGGSLRWANPDDLDAFLGSQEEPTWFPRLRATGASSVDHIHLDQAFEEELFLGLRLNVGVDLDRLRTAFGDARLDRTQRALAEIEDAGLIERTPARVRLTARGRLASNEVFSRLLVA